MNKEEEKFEVIPLDKLLDNLHFKLEVESFTAIHSTTYTDTLVSIIVYLEELKKLKDKENGNTRRSKKVRDTNI